MKVIKVKNENGTFTYKYEDGRVIKKASKKDFEFVAMFGNWAVAFGKYTSCQNELRNKEKEYKDGIEYCKRKMQITQNEEKKAEYQECIESYEYRIQNQRIEKL